jgi:deoxyribodipyrimidine photo-lyase
MPHDIQGETVPSAASLNVNTAQIFECGGEDAATELLNRFVENGVSGYAHQRDLLAKNGTSLLSRHLHFGTISVSKVVDRARRTAGSQVFLSEIAWRDFYFQILFHHPEVEHGAFRSALNNIAWENDEDLFNAWCEGRTGYPIVDAAMRQLNQEAWMHNRARMITASFLTKDLLINWQWGERYFMRKLVDGDLAANNGGWQWSAGTGADAQPFFRIFNPIAQGEKFDPDGEYVRKYVPELKKLPNSVIHSPWKLSALEQQACGCILGKDYPFPLVDHKTQRLRALSLYRAAGEQD